MHFEVINMNLHINWSFPGPIGEGGDRLSLCHHRTELIRVIGAVMLQS